MEAAIKTRNVLTKGRIFDGLHAFSDVLRSYRKRANYSECGLAEEINTNRLSAPVHAMDIWKCEHGHSILSSDLIINIVRVLDKNHPYIIFFRKIESLSDPELGDLKETLREIFTKNDRTPMKQNEISELTGVSTPTLSRFFSRELVNHLVFLDKTHEQKMADGLERLGKSSQDIQMFHSLVERINTEVSRRRGFLPEPSF